MIIKRKLMFTYPPELIREPVLYNLGEQFGIVTNIESANIAAERGWIVLELEGEESAIDEGIAWATSKGMRIDPAGEDSQ